MTKREKVVAALNEVVEKYNAVYATGKTVSPAGTRMTEDTARAVKMIKHFADGEVKGLSIRVDEFCGRIALTIRRSSSASMDAMLDAISESKEQLAGPLYEVLDEAVIQRDRQLQFIGAVRKELDMLEKRVRNNRLGAEISAYDFERTVERLRKELWF